MSVIKSYSASEPKARVIPTNIERRPVGPNDVQIAIEHCGVCHTDIHFVNNDWGMTNYPVVPGHEIVGRVTEVGSSVKNFKAGDRAAIGCLVDSCGVCVNCEKGLEQYCLNGFTATYNSETTDPGGFTYGGYSTSVVAKESFILSIPDNLKGPGVAPLLCAGITTYSPLRNWNISPGQKVGVIGLGGLGHMGVKFGRALGAQVTMITSSEQKGEDARMLGAHEVLLSTSANALAKEAGSFDFLLNTIPVDHDLTPFLELLKTDGAMCVVGAVEPLSKVNAAQLIFGRRSLTGSLIGGIAETQEMLNFCGENDILSEVEVIRMDGINEAFERMRKSDVKYRFVIDLATLS
ncbi:MAG: NAD(P)-dependent alcohol dehydrogenase [Opitutales bacterium]|nr:NAD(P)-dependent alcohol dehydrogenase [Opitutales bacterium]